jgi:anti-anti-sigma regulatory factor
LGVACLQREESVAIQLEGVADITCATELKSSLLDAIHSGRPVSVSLDQCTDIDVTVFQLLWAAAREAKSQGVPFTLVSPAPAIILASLTDVGFENFPVPA